MHEPVKVILFSSEKVDARNSSFPSISDHYLVPLTMQVISVPFFCSTNRLWIFLVAHGQLLCCFSDSYSEVWHPKYCWPHIQPVALLWRRNTTWLCKHGDRELCSQSWMTLVGVYSQDTLNIWATPPPHFCLKAACKKGQCISRTCSIYNYGTTSRLTKNKSLQW